MLMNAQICNPGKITSKKTSKQLTEIDRSNKKVNFTLLVERLQIR